MHLNGEYPGVKAVTRCGAKSCAVASYRQHFGIQIANVKLQQMTQHVLRSFFDCGLPLSRAMFSRRSAAWPPNRLMVVFVSIS
jgi:hypothetical protein